MCSIIYLIVTLIFLIINEVADLFQWCQSTGQPAFWLQGEWAVTADAGL